MFEKDPAANLLSSGPIRAAGRRAPVAPSPQDMYERSALEGERRVSSSLLEMVSTGFIAGFTIVFGVIALGITHALVAEPLGPELGKLAGALAFGIGLVFTVVGRAELFTENFLDPIAAIVERRPGASWGGVARLWGIILALNLFGGGALALLVTVEGALPAGAPEALVDVANEIQRRDLLPSLTNAVAAGALLTLMTYLLQGTDSVTGRMVVAYLVGFFVALGPFNHVVVTTLHLFIGMQYGADVGMLDLARNALLSTGGNLVGGLLFVTLTLTARSVGSGRE